VQLAAREIEARLGLLPALDGTATARFSYRRLATSADEKVLQTSSCMLTCMFAVAFNLICKRRGSQGDRSKAGSAPRPGREGYSTAFTQEAGSVLMRKRFKSQYFELHVALLA